VGLSDGGFVEVNAPDLQAGATVVTGEIVKAAGRLAPTPLAPTPSFRR
jgi:hypothetical protein